MLIVTSGRKMFMPFLCAIDKLLFLNKWPGGKFGVRLDLVEKVPIPIRLAIEKLQF